MGYVQIETNQSEIQSTVGATGDKHFWYREVRTGSRSVENSRRNKYLRNGNNQAQEGQISRKEAEFLELEREEHLEYTGIRPEHRQTTEREIA